jgi:hypothetical protein
MGIRFGNLCDDDGWVPGWSWSDASFEKFHWADGGSLVNSPAELPATFAGNWFRTSQPIDFPRFNRNPLRCGPNFRVPRHHHNLPEMILVFRGEYHIAHEKDGKEVTRRVGPGEYFISQPGTPYTMTAGPEGCTYIETWPVPVVNLHTWWYDYGWIGRAGWNGDDTLRKPETQTA